MAQFAISKHRQPRIECFVFSNAHLHNCFVDQRDIVAVVEFRFAIFKFRILSSVCQLKHWIQGSGEYAAHHLNGHQW